MENPPGTEKSVADAAEKGAENEVQPAPKAEEEKKGGFGDFVRIFRYCDTYSWLLNAIALLTSIGSGITLPLMTIVFSQFINKFNAFATGGGTPQAAQQFRDDVDGFV